MAASNTNQAFAQLVAAGNRADFAAELRAMHADRKTVFVDQLKWALAVTDEGLEIDDYDREDTIYLYVADTATGGHLGSVRLLPTDRPHLLGDKFGHLCDAGVPRDAGIFEITRMVTRPGLPRAAAERVREQLSVAITEFAVANGVRGFTMMTHMAFLPGVLSVGWDCEPLGMPRDMDGVSVTALIITIDAATPAALREKYGFGEPVLRLMPVPIGTGGVMAF